MRGPATCFSSRDETPTLIQDSDSRPGVIAATSTPASMQATVAQITGIDSPLRRIGAAAAHLVKLGVPEASILKLNMGDPLIHGWSPPPIFFTLLREAKGKMTPENKASLGAKIRKLIESGISDEIIGSIIETVLAADDAAIDPDHLGYSRPGHGLLEAREWLVKRRLQQDPADTLTPDDVIFFDGTSDALKHVFDYLIPPGKTGLIPSPGYPNSGNMLKSAVGENTHTYQLDPNDNWQPDLAQFEEVLRDHGSEIGMLELETWNNPLGQYIEEDCLRKMLELIHRHAPQAFVLIDDIYDELYFDENDKPPNATKLAREAGVPAISIFGGSKAIPCTGFIRTGAITAHYSDSGHDGFKKRFECLRDKKMNTRLGAGTAQQLVLPALYESPEFVAHLESMRSEIGANARALSTALNGIDSIRCVPPKGTFYVNPILEVEDDALRRTVDIRDPKVRSFIAGLSAASDNHPDDIFALNLLGAHHIAAVPLSRMRGPNGLRLIAPLLRVAEQRDRVVDAFQRMMEQIAA